MWGGRPTSGGGPHVVRVRYLLQSASRPPSGVSTSHVGQRVPESDQDLVEIKLAKMRGGTLSSEQIRSRAIGNFLKGYVHNLFDSVLFPNDPSLIQFVKYCDPGRRISQQSVSNLRRRPRAVCFRYLPVTETSLDFINRVKELFPNFDGEELYALSGTHVKYRRLLLVRPQFNPYCLLEQDWAKTATTRREFLPFHCVFFVWMFRTRVYEAQNWLLSTEIQYVLPNDRVFSYIVRGPPTDYWHSTRFHPLSMDG